MDIFWNHTLFYYTIGHVRYFKIFLNMTPKLFFFSKSFKIPLSLNSHKRFAHKESHTKYRSLTIKPRSHVGILI